MRLSLIFAVLAVSTTALVSADISSAQAAVSLSDTKRAIDLYREGLQLLENDSFSDALSKLTASYDLLPSPNTLLLMAHAHRELGDGPKAASLYEKVIVDAQKRIDAGEDRFKQTKADAEHWIEELSKSLGHLKVTVLHVPPNSRVVVDGKAIEMSRQDDDTFRSEKMWWTVGSVEVVVEMPGRKPSVTHVEVSPGETAVMSLDVRGIEQPSSVKQPEVDLHVDEGSGSIPIGTWVGLGVGVAGLGTFALFGSMSQSKASELDECAPNCPDSKHDVADTGKTYQSIANVGLIVGGVGLLTGAGFYLFQSKSKSDDVSVVVGPSHVQVSGHF